MLHLLKLEWLKLKNYILFRVLVLAYLVMLPSLLMIGKKIMVLDDSIPFDPQKMLFHFPSVWEWLAYVGNWLTFFIFGFLAVLTITNEHAYRTLRQNVITGMQRSEWFWSKALFILTIGALATLYYSICSIVIGLWHIDDTWYLSTIFKNSDVALRYFLMATGYMSFGMLVGILVKRTGIALFAFFGYAFFLEPVIRWVIHMRLYSHRSMHYYPMNVFEDLCPMPIMDMANGFSKDNGFELFVEPATAIFLSVLYILLFGAASWLRLQKSDL